jgi:1-acyl-sn-glycerol-3-phosphate acyltransferase
VSSEPGDGPVSGAAAPHATAQSALAFVRSLAYAVGQIASTLVFGLLSPLTFPLPFRMRYWFITRWTRFNLWWLEKTCRLGYRIEGVHNIPPGNGIVLSKHQSGWETLGLQLLFPPQVWVVKRELLRLPFFGWGLAMLEPIAIDRRAGRKALDQLVSQGRKRLQAGRWVVVFPEGTRVPPGARSRYGIGGAMLAQKTGYPVIPVAHNAGEFWPRRSFTKRPGTIQVVIGPLIDSRGRSAAEINAAAEQWIEQTMRRISALTSEAAGRPIGQGGG